MWGNRPDKPVGVYSVKEPVVGAGKVVQDGQTELLWQQVLRRQGPPLAFAVTLPGDPTQN